MGSRWAVGSGRSARGIHFPRTEGCPARARALRRLRPDLPVVLTTVYSEALADGGVEGMALLRKPYSVEALSKAMRRAAAPRR